MEQPQSSSVQQITLECRIVGKLLADHALSYALTATAHVPVVCLTSRLTGHDQTKINVMQIFHAYPRFTKLIIADLMDKYELIPRILEEEYHTIKDDTLLVNVYTTGEVTVRGILILNDLLTDAIKDTQAYKDYVDKYRGKKRKGKQVVGESSSPRPSLKIGIRQQKLTSTAPLPPKRGCSYESDGNEFADTVLLSDQDFGDRLESGSHMEKQEKIDDDDDKKKDGKHDDAKDDKNDDDNNDDDDHDDHSLIKTQRTGSSEIRTKKMLTPIPLPPRSLRMNLSSDKAITEEFTVSYTHMPDASTQDRPKPISRRYTHIQGFVKRMCKRQGFMMQHMQKKFVTNIHFQGILEKVNESFKEIIAKIAKSATNDLTKDNLPRLVTDAVKKERESSQPVVSAQISQEFATHAPQIIEEIFRIYMHNMVLIVHPTTSTFTATTFTL
ncbi:hypothetical protein Tco_0755590 [Tanacetum coccineum]